MKSRGLGPHSRRHRLGHLDRRTFEGKLFDGFRAKLLDHVGGLPTVTQAAIIERACWVNLRGAMMDAKVATGDFTEQDSNCYLAWANTLGRLLARLGLEPAAAPRKTLAVHNAEVAAREAREAAAA
jgi:hypothetical protein